MENFPVDYSHILAFIIGGTVSGIIGGLVAWLIATWRLKAQSSKVLVEKQAEILARKEKIARTGGQLLSAAFAFLGEMFPEKEETQQSMELTGIFKERLAECMDRGEDGELKMTITLPDESVLENLAKSLAKIAGLR